MENFHTAPRASVAGLLISELDGLLWQVVFEEIESLKSAGLPINVTQSSMAGFRRQVRTELAITFIEALLHVHEKDERPG